MLDDPRNCLFTGIALMLLTCVRVVTLIIVICSQYSLLADERADRVQAGKVFLSKTRLQQWESLFTEGVREFGLIRVTKDVAGDHGPEKLLSPTCYPPSAANSATPLATARPAGSRSGVAGAGPWIAWPGSAASAHRIRFSRGSHQHAEPHRAPIVSPTAA